MLCSIEGCRKQSVSGGLCGTHYQRKRRTGHVDSHRPIKMSASYVWIIKNAFVSHDTCVTWPFSKTQNGYGQTTFNGKAIHAHRLVCIFAHGKAPTVEHQVAHACGNRSCVNANHLRWATAVENAADRVLHGTHLEGEKANPAKLTNEDASVIRRDKRKRKEIADQYGISVAAVSLIRSGRTYKSALGMN